MDREGFLFGLEIEFPVRVGEDPLPKFLLHHLPLGIKISVIDGQRGHPFRFRPQDWVEIIRRNDLMVNGHVVRGVGVVFAADVFGQFIKRIPCQMLIPFEHHVLEEMGEAAAVLRIILRADVIPNLDGHGRGGVIFHAINFEPVRESRVLELERRNGQRRCGRRGLLTKKRGRKDEAENNKDGGEFHESGYRSEVRHSRERKGADVAARRPYQGGSGPERI